MITNNFFKRDSDETEEDYIIRVCSNKIGYTWPEIGQILNESLGYDYTEGRYRHIYRNHLASILVEDDSDEFVSKKIEFEKAKVKTRDLVSAYNKSIREEARREYLEELVKEEIRKIKPYPLTNTKDIITDYNDNDMIICLNDIHWGINIDSYWNKYNPKIAKKRLQKYLLYIKEARDIFKSKNCHLTLGGDNISGNIHYTITLNNRYNVVQQVIGASELISWFTVELSQLFNEVNVISQAGNHSRIAEKDKAPKDERLDDLIPWYLKARTLNHTNIKIHDYCVDNSFSLFNVRGKDYLLVHGDYDNPTNLHKILDLIPKKNKIESVFLAHMHHNELNYKYGMRTLNSGSLVGMDEYCIEKRIMGKAQQMLCIANNKGIEYFRDCDLQ